MVVINLKKTVSSRFWRIRPMSFNGGENDYWAIQSLQLMEYEKTDVENIQDKIFLENRDRAYEENPVRLKGAYTPVDSQSFLSKFGFNSMFSTDQYFFELSFRSIVSRLSRPFVIEDILEIPSETQFDSKLRPVSKYLEVTDVTWSTTGFTPAWKPTIQRIIAQPVMSSQETQDILGKITADKDDTGLFDNYQGYRDGTKKYQDVEDISQEVRASANTDVPQRGKDYANVQKLSEDFYERHDEIVEEKNLEEGFRPEKFDRSIALFGEDAMPPNGEEYTEGDNFPENPSDGDYHRLTYRSISNAIPPRLHRFSVAKNRWVFLAKDMRYKRQSANATLKRYRDPNVSTTTDPNNVDNEFKK
jgi:hypothetical protein